MVAGERVSQFTGGLTPNQLYNTPQQDHSYLITTNYAHVFTPRVTNEFTFGFNDGYLLYGSAATISYDNSAANPFNQYLQNTGLGKNTGSWGSGSRGMLPPATMASFATRMSRSSFLTTSTGIAADTLSRQASVTS